MTSFLRTILVIVLVLASAAVSYAATGTYLEPNPVKPWQVADNRDVVHDETTGTIVHSSSGACVRTQWSNCCDVCGTEVIAATPHISRHTTALSREERTAYFGFNQAYLSPEMKQRLDTLATALRSDDQVKGARIVGFADRLGNPGYNEKLSKKRAEAVRKYLVAKGIINTSIADTRWLGARAPTAECSDSLSRTALIDCLQKDRRVEVEIDYIPDVDADAAQ